MTDVNYSPVTNFTEMEFVVPGPGALDGIRKCFADTAGLNESEVIRFMADRQELEFERLGSGSRRCGGGGCSSSTARTCSARWTSTLACDTLMRPGRPAGQRSSRSSALTRNRSRIGTRRSGGSRVHVPAPKPSGEASTAPRRRCAKAGEDAARP